MIETPWICKTLFYWFSKITSDGNEVLSSTAKIDSDTTREWLGSSWRGRTDRFYDRPIATYSIKTILREEFGIVSIFDFPQEGKRSRLPLLPSCINFSPLTAIFSWKNYKITQRKIQTWVPFWQKCQDKTFFLNLKITSLNKGDKYLSIKLRRKKKTNK